MFFKQLSFTPTVIDGDLINLVLETEVSAIDTSVQVQAAGITLSGFTTRRARTTVELRDGQSLSIAGLLQEDFSDGKTQVPWLGDLPILGTLFRSSDFSRSQRISITALKRAENQIQCPQQVSHKKQLKK